MEIIFAQFIENRELIKSLTPEQLILIGEVYYYVERRLKPLENEINKEEAKGSNMATIIHLTKEGINFNFKGYPKELVNKMKMCFSQSDMKYLIQKIGNSLEGLLN